MQSIIATLAGGYAALVGLSKISYRALLYPAPRRGLVRTPAGAELRELRASDGEPVQVLQFRSGAAATLVYFHGNGEVIADNVPLARALLSRGLDVVLVEYRGYGSSPARRPTEQGLYADAEGVLHALAAEGVDASRTILWGTSLGSGVAVEMATRGHAAGLILSTPYTSVPDVAAGVVPFLPVRWLIADKYDSLSKAARVLQPTLILHGDSDGVVPYHMGVRLSEAIAGAKLITVKGGGHNDLFVRERDRLLDAVAQHARECVV